MRIFKKKIIFLLFIASGLLLSALYKPALAQTTATVAVSPTSSTVALGDTKTINITVSGAQNIAGFGGTLKYNPAVVKVNAVSDVTLGPFLGSGASLLPVIIDNTAGTVIFGGYVLASTGVSGSGTLINITLTTVGSGTSTLTLQDISLGTADTPPISQPTKLVNGTITVTGTASPSPTPSPTPPPSPSMLPSATPSTSPSTAAVTISPATNNISVGESKTINIQVSGAQNIAGFGGTLKYNPAVVKVNAVSDVTLGPFLGSGASLLPVIIDNTAGTVIFGGYVLAQGASGNGTLISIKLNGVGMGTSSLVLQDVSLGTADVPPQEQPTTVSGGTITVSANPSPTPPAVGVLLRMSLEGINKNVGDQSVDIELQKISDGSTLNFPDQRITFESGKNYITSDPLINPTLVDDSYHIIINGPKHLTKKFFAVQITNGQIIDVSTPPLLSADIIDDNIVNALDFNTLINNFGCKPGVKPPGKSCSPLQSDLDFDEDVDIFDYGYLVKNYNEVGD